MKRQSLSSPSRYRMPSCPEDKRELLTKIYNENFERLLWFARFLSRDEDKAVEITVDAYFNVLEKWEEALKFKRGPYYFYRNAVRFAWYDYLKEEKKRRKVIADKPTDNAQQWFESKAASEETPASKLEKSDWYGSLDLENIEPVLGPHTLAQFL